MTNAAVPPLAQWKRWLPGRPVLIGWAVLAVVLVWTYWSTIGYLLHTWWTLPDYGHGFFVPLFAAVLLWLRQDMVDPWPKGGTWWAMPLFAVWALARWANLYFNYDRDSDSLFPLLVGIALFLGGWRALRWAWPSILFLGFMVPLPSFLQAMLSRPLQHIATRASVYSLQTLGISAIIRGDQGNVIQLPDPCPPLEVERACSGLSMLTLFFAVCVGAAFVIRARWWEKAIILVSAVPIAVFANVVRISLHGVLDMLISPAVGEFVHDYAGWFMMPLAMLIIWGEMTLISKLLFEIPSEGPLALNRSPASLPGDDTAATRRGAAVAQDRRRRPGRR